MELGAAIRGWGRAHRDSLDDDERLALTEMWRHVREAGHDSMIVEDMSRDDARDVMRSFAKEDRAAAASRLNDIRRWAIAEAEQPSDLKDAEPQPQPEPEPEEAEIDVPADLGGWGKPVAPAEPQHRVDRRGLALVGISLVIVAVLAWWVMVRDEVEAPPSEEVPVSVNPTQDDEDTDESNAFFVEQFDIEPALADCLTAELGDLISAATKTELLNREVCGTTLIDVITGA